MAILEHQSEVVDGYLRTAPPASSLPWHQASFAVLGLEATGQDQRRDQLVSVACVPVEGGKAMIGKAFEGTIGPGGVALEPIVEALTGRIVVAHGASRHMGFLSAVFGTAGLRLHGQALDTAVLAAWVPPGAPADGDRSWSHADIPPGLSEAASAIGLPVHRPHEAGGEALTTAQLFMALASKLDQVHPQSVGSLARLCSKNGDCNQRASR
ncbi:MAG TPA: 3'-5' exonuclease [Solirubrobacterales bacterium]